MFYARRTGTASHPFQGAVMCIILYYIILYYIILYYVILYYIILYYIILYYIILRYIKLHYITLHYITLHYITLYYIILYYIKCCAPRRSLVWLDFNLSVYVKIYFNTKILKSKEFFPVKFIVECENTGPKYFVLLGLVPS